MFSESRKCIMKNHVFFSGLLVFTVLTTSYSTRLFAAVSLSFPITVTFLDVSAPTTPYLEHYEETGDDVRPGSWWDVDNAVIRTSGTGQPKGTAKVSLATTSKNYGHVESDGMTLNFDTLDTVRLVILSVDSATAFKVFLDDGARKEIASGLGVGVHDIGINATAPIWSGNKSFHIDLLVESATANTGTRFDEVWIYKQSTNGYVEHFEDLGDDVRPGSWWDVDNATIRTSGLGQPKGAAKVALVSGAKGYGHVESDGMTLNFDTFKYMRIVVTQIDSGTAFKVFLDDGSRKLICEYLNAGIHYIDINASAPVWSGTKSFHIDLLIEGSVDGTGTTFDEIKIGSQEN
ncbi:MAG: hypothetical protein AB1439_12700 [candidate division FCPU426 bacterium]